MANLLTSDKITRITTIPTKPPTHSLRGLSFKPKSKRSTNKPVAIPNVRFHGLSRVIIETQVAEATRFWTVVWVSTSGDGTEGSTVLVGTAGGGSFDGAWPIVSGTFGKVSGAVFTSIVGGACAVVPLDIHCSTEAALGGRCAGFLARQAIIMAQTASGT